MIQAPRTIADKKQTDRFKMQVKIREATNRSIHIGKWKPNLLQWLPVAVIVVN